MQLPRHLAQLDHAEGVLATALLRVAGQHPGEPDVASIASTLADVDERRRADLVTLRARYPDRSEGPPPGSAHAPSVPGDGSLLADLQDLHTLASWVNIAWSIAGQAARALRDEDLRDVADRGATDTLRHLRWLRGRINQAAAQALVLG